MRKLLVFLLVLVISIPVGAVLKERNLARTLAVLRAELEHSEVQQQEEMRRYALMQHRQHDELVDYMQRSEQVALMLYSQKQEFTFDVAYACQQATDLYRELSAKTLPYARIQAKMQDEITRYDGLIQSLQALPPAVVVDDDGCIVTKDAAKARASKRGKHAEKQAALAFDSISQQNVAKVDSLASQLGVDDVTVQAVADSVMHLSDAYMLDAAQQADRDTCLAIALRIRARLQSFQESVNADNLYYKAVTEKVEGLNKYAQERYKTLQSNIFVNAGDNYFKVLLKLPETFDEVRAALGDKYVSFGGSASSSEWRGPIVKFVTLYLLLWLLLAVVVSQLILRLFPKRWMPADYQRKRWIYYIVGGNLVFSITVFIIHGVITQNFLVMATGLVTNFSWLALAIFLSLLIRVEADKISACVRTYLPFMVLAFLVIACRIMFVPNVLVNLLFPPFLLLFCIWQLRSMRRQRGSVYSVDVLYSSLSLTVMVIGTVLSWAGYVLFAVEIMVWWMFLLAAMQTITSIYFLLDIYERRSVLKKVKGRIDVDSDGFYDSDGTEIVDSDVLGEMKAGVYITSTWAFDFFKRVAVPILGVASVAFSIWYSADIFEMTEALRNLFYYDFINKEGIMRLSLNKMLIVVCVWFVFRYLNYALRSFYHHIKRTHIHLRPEQYNFTLANNVIAIFIWGCYVLYVLFLLQVPKSGISVVTAGLATGMGFAMKDLLENFFYGISLMTGRVRVGDYIECDGMQGRVDSITYQSTQLVAYDGSVIAFLNTQLFSKNFKNLTRNHHYELVKVPIGVAYGTDIQHVRNLIVERLQPFHRQLPDGRSLLRPDSAISVVFSDFGSSSVDLLVCYWVLVDQKIAVAGQIKEAIYNILNEKHVEIPFPQCDVHIRS